MADEKTVAIRIKFVDNVGKSGTTNINYVNPEATNAELITAASMFNSLTTNTYNSTDRIETITCDTTPDPTRKTKPTFTIAKNVYSWATDKDQTGTITIPITYSGDGNVYFGNDGDDNFFLSIVDRSGLQGYISTWKVTPTLPQVLTLNASEGENYAEADPITVTITA